MKKTDNKTLIVALRILARDIESGDGVANGVISEAADRLEEYASHLSLSVPDLPHGCTGIEHRRIEPGEWYLEYGKWMQWAQPWQTALDYVVATKEQDNESRN